MRRKLFAILLFLFLIILIFIIFFLIKKPQIIKKEIIKEKEKIELPEKEKKIIKKSIKEKIIISQKRIKKVDYDVYLMKINSAGDLVWEKTFNNNSIDWAEFAFQTIENNIFLLCRSYNINENQEKFYIIKTDMDGNMLWMKDFEEFYATEEKTMEIKEGFITMSRTLTDDNKDYEIYISASDRNGNYLWTRNFSNKYYEWGYFVLLTEDGSYFIGEDFDYPDMSFCLQKKDIYGRNLWLKSYGMDELNKGYAIIPGIDSGYILAGVSYLFNNNDGGSAAYLLKIDDEGNKVWEKLFKGNGYNEIFSIAKDDNNYFLAGTTNLTGTDSYDVYLIKTDVNGNKIWEKTFGGGGNDAAYHIYRCNDDNFIVTGVTRKNL